MGRSVPLSPTYWAFFSCFYLGLLPHLSLSLFKSGSTPSPSLMRGLNSRP